MAEAIQEQFASTRSPVHPVWDSFVWMGARLRSKLERKTRERDDEEGQGHGRVIHMGRTG